MGAKACSSTLVEVKVAPQMRMVRMAAAWAARVGFMGLPPWADVRRGARNGAAPGTGPETKKRAARGQRA